MPSAAAPSGAQISHSKGTTIPPLEGGEGEHIQILDMVLKDSPNDQWESIDLEKCYKHWYMKYADIVNRVPSELPPLWEINHRIPLIDNSKRYYYHLLHCPDAMKLQLMEKLQTYVDAGWWIPKVVSQ